MVQNKKFECQKITHQNTIFFAYLLLCGHLKISMLGEFQGSVYMCVLLLLDIYSANPAFANHLGASSCFLNWVVEDRRFLRIKGSFQIVKVQSMILGVCKPQKDLSQAEKQAFEKLNLNLKIGCLAWFQAFTNLENLLKLLGYTAQFFIHEPSINIRRQCR